MPSKQIALPHPVIRADPAHRMRQLFAGDEPFATTMLVWTLDAFGPEAVEWTPQTLRHELQKDLAVQLRPQSIHKLMAAIAIVTTDLFFKDAERFIKLANVLSGAPMSDVFDYADSFETAWAVVEGLLLNPPERDEADSYFSDDIRRYMGVVLREEGYTAPPAVLQMAMDADLSDQVSADFADDPELFSAMYNQQQERTTDLDVYVRDRLKELFAQLQSLPLRQGSVKDLVKKITA